MNIFIYVEVVVARVRHVILDLHCHSMSESELFARLYFIHPTIT